jgi:hypothetical protein
MAAHAIVAFCWLQQIFDFLFEQLTEERLDELLEPDSWYWPFAGRGDSQAKHLGLI